MAGLAWKPRIGQPQAGFDPEQFFAISIALFNQLTGINAIVYYSNYIFASAGFSSKSAALQSVGVGIVNLASTILGMSLIDKLGRKTLLLIGAIQVTGPYNIYRRTESPGSLYRDTSRGRRYERTLRRILRVREFVSRGNEC
jgi:hypothetical protein